MTPSRQCLFDRRKRRKIAQDREWNWHGLSSRAVTFLKSIGKKSLEDLVFHKVHMLTNYKGCGKKTFLEIHKVYYDMMLEKYYDKS